MSEPLVFRGVRAASRETGLPRDLLYGAIRAGQLRVVRSGRTSLIPRDEIRRWLESEMAGQS
jgi:excisionase family DNA binding protein